MPGASTSGLGQPSTEGTAQGRRVLDEPGDPEAIFPLGIETGSIILRADPLNDGTIYIGWDEEVSDLNGFYMQPGDRLSIALDVSEQAIWAVAEQGGDEIRYLGVN